MTIVTGHKRADHRRDRRDKGVHCCSSGGAGSWRGAGEVRVDMKVSARGVPESLSLDPVIVVGYATAKARSAIYSLLFTAKRLSAHGSTLRSAV